MARTFQKRISTDGAHFAEVANRMIVLCRYEKSENGEYRVTKRKCISASLEDIVHCRRHELEAVPIIFFPRQNFP